jgi:phenylalanyl-tRNA synthetase beta subunit
VEEPALDAVARRPARVGWRLGARELERFAGCPVADAEIERILGALGFGPRLAGERTWQGEVPSWRSVDFEPRRPAAGGPAPASPAPAAPEAWAQDVYEEVLRHVGLDRIPATLPALGGADEGASPAHERRSPTSAGP